MRKKSFSIHSDFYGELRNLSQEERGTMLLALINWASDCEIPALEPAPAILFRLMCAQIERISSANSKNGKNGGAPSGNQNAGQKTSETTETTETPKNKPPVSVTDTVSASNAKMGIPGHARMTVDILPQGFDEFWNAYPRKVKKADAVKAWNQVRAYDHIESILTVLPLFIASAEWQKGGGQFVPYPASWLRARRWEDENLPTEQRSVLEELYREEMAVSVQ